MRLGGFMKRILLVFTAFCSIAGLSYADESVWTVQKTTDAFGKIKSADVEAKVAGYRPLDGGKQPCSMRIIISPSRQLKDGSMQDSIHVIMSFTPQIMFSYGDYITIGMMSGDDFAELKFQFSGTYTPILSIPRTAVNFDFLRILSSGGTVKIGITLAVENLIFDVDVSDFVTKLAEARLGKE
jgi:hypothetical protein